MKLYYLPFLLFLLTGCERKDSTSTANFNSSSIHSNFNLHWADSSYWNDGKAEVVHYTAVRTIYKKKRFFEFTYITVSEDFNKEFRAKTGDYSRRDLYKVMKVNAFARIPTDNYPYHFLATMIFIRNNPLKLDKVTISSQEWCGNTFKEYRNNKSGFQLRFHSYWDGEGSGERSIPDKSLLFEDQLNYSLRSLNFKKGLQFDFPVLATQITNKVGTQQIYHAKLSVHDADTAWKVSVRLAPGKINEYTFGKKYPNILLSQTTWDQRDMTLREISRYKYWFE